MSVCANTISCQDSTSDIISVDPTAQICDVSAKVITSLTDELHTEKERVLQLKRDLKTRKHTIPVAAHALERVRLELPEVFMRFSEQLDTAGAEAERLNKENQLLVLQLETVYKRLASVEKECVSVRTRAENSESKFMKLSIQLVSRREETESLTALVMQCTNEYTMTMELMRRKANSQVLSHSGVRAPHISHPPHVQLGKRPVWFNGRRTSWNCGDDLSQRTARNYESGTDSECETSDTYSRSRSNSGEGRY